MDLPGDPDSRVDGEHAHATAPPLLSICIATLNRAAFIGETLDSIIAQLTPDVEIVVVDGASNDGTDVLLQGYQRRCPALRYHRLSRNNGVDQDYCTAVDLAAGRYCWLMSDDDVLKDGAVDSVLSAIAAHHDLIVVNAEVRNFDLSEVLDGSRLSFNESRQYRPEDMDRLFEDAGEYLTFIGCVVIRRELWQGREHAAYFGSMFIHVGVIFQRHLEGTALVIGSPFIAIRYGNAMWKSREFEIWMQKWPTLISSLPGLSEPLRRRISGRTWRLKTLLYYRAKGTYSIAEYRRWSANMGFSAPKRALARCIALFPGAIANLLGLLYYSLFSKGTRMPIVDMRKSRFYPGNWFAVRN